jgi:hypothetical protein
MVQRIVAGGKQIQALGEDLFEGVPEVLRPETLGGESPGRIQNRAAVPVGHFSFRSWLTDAMDGRQQQVVRRRRSLARRRPERFEQGARMRAGSVRRAL